MEQSTMTRKERKRVLQCKENKEWGDAKQGDKGNTVEWER